MTKVELPFRLSVPLDNTIAGRIADAHKIYGIISIRFSADLHGLRVEYDATRMTPDDVESALTRGGIPAIRV